MQTVLQKGSQAGVSSVLGWVFEVKCAEGGLAVFHEMPMGFRAMRKIVLSAR